MRRAIILAAALTFGALVLAHCGGSETPGPTITDLAPTAGEVVGWAPLGAAQVFEGDDLFELINGGAEIHHEFGFRRALSGDYAGAEQRLIALEVFEMEDTAAAYGVYSFKISGNGRSLELGDEAMLEDYYLNLRRGRFVVTLTAMSADEDSVQGLVQIARAVAEKIQGNGEAPAIVAELAAGNRRPERIFYVRGELALGNVVPFAVGTRFGMIEGAAARFSDHTDFILRYPDADRARQQFGAVIGELGTRSSLTPVEDVDGESVMFTDGEGTQVRLALVDEAIVAVLAVETVDTEGTLEELVSRVTGAAAAGDR